MRIAPPRLGAVPAWASNELASRAFKLARVGTFPALIYFLALGDGWRGWKPSRLCCTLA